MLNQNRNRGADQETVGLPASPAMKLFGVTIPARAPDLRVDHVDRRTGGERGDLVVDVGELEIELVLGDVTDVRRRDHRGVAQHRVVRVEQRFGVEHVERQRAGPACRERRLQRAGRDEARARRVDERRRGLHREEVVCGDDAARRRRQLDVDADEIALRKECGAARPDRCGSFASCSSAWSAGVSPVARMRSSSGNRQLMGHLLRVALLKSVTPGQLELVAVQIRMRSMKCWLGPRGGGSPPIACRLGLSRYRSRPSGLHRGG